MDDIYTPGYDGLLRRKEADLRRAKICKLLALIGTAVAIILIIVIPICTMGSWRPLQKAHTDACFHFIYFQQLCAEPGNLHAILSDINGWDCDTWSLHWYAVPPYTSLHAGPLFMTSEKTGGLEL